MYDSIRGTIKSGWKRDGQTIVYTFTIPVNTAATIHLHANDPSGITEGGAPARQAKGTKFLWSEGGVAAFQLESGTYEFTVK
jgi:alpha-L-rhamnosidase